MDIDYDKNKLMEGGERRRRVRPIRNGYHSIGIRGKVLSRKEVEGRRTPKHLVQKRRGTRRWRYATEVEGRK